MAVVRTLRDLETGSADSPHLSLVDGSTGDFASPRFLQRPRVTVVVPTLNEERNVAWVLGRIPDSVDEIVLVDGRSTDRTIEVALAVRPDVVVVRESTPGKGAALRAAFAAATGDVIVMLDADGSMTPAEIPEFVARIVAGADLVKGSRFLPRGGSVDISRLRRTGNAALLTFANVIFRRRFTELCYGFMAFRRDRLPDLELQATGFEIETEIVVRAVKAGLAIEEVPSFESARRHGVSNLHTFRDGWRVLMTLLRERVGRSPWGDAAVLIEPMAALAPVSAEEPEIRQEA
jgi:glycosyltransferase involved in cell wall biosynthesis